MIATMSQKPIAGPATQSPEWYAMRKFDPSRTERPVVFGASEAAAACGRSKYDSALKLYLEKRGEITDEATEEEAERMQTGKDLEPVILRMYERRTNTRLITELPMFFSAEYPFIAATPDAKPVDGDDLIIEAKRTTFRMNDRTGVDTDKFGEAGTDAVPMDYLFQAQQQCLVMGASRVDFPVLLDGATLSIYTVYRDEDLIAEIIKAEKELAERIINGDPPEPDFQHSGTLKLLQRMQGCEVGKVISWPEEIAAKWQQFDQIKSQLKILEKSKDALSAELFAAMEDAEQAVCGPLTVKRINVKASSYTVEKAAYSYLKASTRK